MLHRMPTPPTSLHLDASESVFFKRQLEFVDRQMYEVVFPENKARQLVPTQQGIPDWARVYTWRMFSKVGRAKIIANTADDIPRADATGEEDSKIIKPIAASHGWDIFEIKGAAATGTPLDAMKAAASRFAIETEMDRILALGDAAHNLDGLLALTGTVTRTPDAKTGGGTTWAAATPKEMAADVTGLIQKIITTMKGSGGPVFQRFVVTIPYDQYGLIAQTQFSSSSDVTVLTWLLANSPWLEAIEPWQHCAGAGAGTTDRMCAYPRNPLVLSGIVPMEYTTEPPEKRNLEYVVNALATCGGVVARYPVSIGYSDGI